jgi:hypothetical protein
MTAARKFGQPNGQKSNQGKIVAAGNLAVYISSLSDERCGGTCHRPEGGVRVRAKSGV